MNTITVGATQFANNVGYYLQIAQEQKVVITKNGKAVVEVKKSEPRTLGELAEDFWAHPEKYRERIKPQFRHYHFGVDDPVTQLSGILEGQEIDLKKEKEERLWKKYGNV